MIHKSIEKNPKFWLHQRTHNTSKIISKISLSTKDIFNS